MEFELTFETPQQAEKAADWIFTWPKTVRIPVACIDRNKIEFYTKGEQTIVIVKVPEHLPGFFSALKRELQEGPLGIVPCYQLTPKSDLFTQLWPSGLFSDVTLEIEGEQFQVHRVVLGLLSPYFKALFTTMSEASQKIIQIKEIPSKVFSRLLNLIYGHRIEFKGLEGLRLLVLMQRFQLEIDLESVIKKLEVPEEDLLEYLELIRQLYPTEYPYWFISHLFDKIIPSFSTPIREILPLLPQELCDVFIEEYDID